MKAHLLCLAGTLLLGACQTPESVRTLSRSSSALITETRSAAPAVQQFFAKQDRLVEGRIADWDTRKQRAETLSVPYETLWAMDQDADDKRNDNTQRTGILALIRRNGAEVSPLSTPRAASTPSPAGPATIAKMTGLLEAVASGKSETAGFYLSYWQALSSSLQELNKDAAVAAAAPEPDSIAP